MLIVKTKGFCATNIVKSLRSERIKSLISSFIELYSLAPCSTSLKEKDVAILHEFPRYQY